MLNPHLPQSISSTDKTKEIVFLYHTDSSGDFRITDKKYNKDRWGKFKEIIEDGKQFLDVHFKDEAVNIFGSIKLVYDEKFIPGITEALDRWSYYQ